MMGNGSMIYGMGKELWNNLGLLMLGNLPTEKKMVMVVLRGMEKNKHMTERGRTIIIVNNFLYMPLKKKNFCIF